MNPLVLLLSIAVALTLATWHSDIALADDSADDVPATVRLTVNVAPNAAPTTLVVEINGTRKQTASMEVRADASPEKPATVTLDTGALEVMAAPVYADRPLWVATNVVAPDKQTLAFGCGPHLPADASGCQRVQAAESPASVEQAIPSGQAPADSVRAPDLTEGPNEIEVRPARLPNAGGPISGSAPPFYAIIGCALVGVGSYMRRFGQYSKSRNDDRARTPIPSPAAVIVPHPQRPSISIAPSADGDQPYWVKLKEGYGSRYSVRILGRWLVTYGTYLRRSQVRLSASWRSRTARVVLSRGSRRPALGTITVRPEMLGPRSLPTLVPVRGTTPNAVGWIGHALSAMLVSWCRCSECAAVRFGGENPTIGGRKKAGRSQVTLHACAPRIVGAQDRPEVAVDDAQTPTRAHHPFRQRASVQPQRAATMGSRRLRSRLRAELTDEQWGLHAVLADLEAAARLAERDRFIEELCRHFPAIESVIRTTAFKTVGGPVSKRDPPLQANGMTQDQLRLRLRSELTDEQWSLCLALADVGGARTLAERDRFVDELCQQCPGLAPALRAVPGHIIETPVSEEGTCCTQLSSVHGDSA